MRIFYYFSSLPGLPSFNIRKYIFRDWCYRISLRLGLVQQPFYPKSKIKILRQRLHDFQIFEALTKELAASRQQESHHGQIYVRRRSVRHLFLKRSASAFLTDAFYAFVERFQDRKKKVTAIVSSASVLFDDFKNTTLSTFDLCIR